MTVRIPAIPALRRTIAAFGSALSLATLALATVPVSAAEHHHPPVAGKIEVVAELPIRPGNVAATPQGRVFATVHPLGTHEGVQLIEITGRNQYRPWPDARFQNDGTNYSDDRIDSPLGIYRDDSNRIWIVDMGLNIGKTRVWGFSVASGKLVRRYDLPEDIAPRGSFVQDLVVDDRNGWMYLADIAKPGIIAVDMKSGAARRFSGHPALQAEPDAAMVIDGQPVLFQGKPASVAINPITLSADRETLHFGAMNGRNWYRVPAKLFREGASDAQIGAAIERAGPKPVSDGAATDAYGNHYFTSVNEHGLDVLGTDGELRPFVRDPRMIWPDSAQFGAPGALYVAVNQLYKAAGFTGGVEEGRPPYYLLKINTRCKSVPR